MPINVTAKVAIGPGSILATVLRMRCAKRRANRCCSKARIFPRRILPPYHVAVSRMNTRSRLSRVSVRLETVGRHRTTRVNHASDSQGFTYYTMHISSVFTIWDKTGVHPTCCNNSPNSVALSSIDVPPLLGFLQHSPHRLCYDGAAHVHTGRAPGREETRWTLSPWWIRCSP